MTITPELLLSAAVVDTTFSFHPITGNGSFGERLESWTIGGTFQRGLIRANRNLIMTLTNFIKCPQYHLLPFQHDKLPRFLSYLR